MSNQAGIPVDPEKVIRRLAQKNADAITQITILETAIEGKDEEIVELKKQIELLTQEK